MALLSAMDSRWTDGPGGGGVEAVPTVFPGHGAMDVPPPIGAPDPVGGHGNDVHTHGLDSVEAGPVHGAPVMVADGQSHGVNEYMHKSVDGFSTPQKNPILSTSVSHFTLV